MNENPLPPSEDSSPKEHGKPEDPSILDYLIQSLGNFPRSFRSNTTTKSSPAESPMPDGDSSQVESLEAQVPAQASAEPDAAVQPDSNRRTLLQIKLPFGAFVTFGVEKEPARAMPVEKKTGQSKPRRLFINSRAKRQYSIPTVVCSALLSLIGFWLLFQATLGWMAWVLLFNGVFVYIFATRVGEEGKVSLWDYLTHGWFDFGVRDWQKICLAVSVGLGLAAAVTAGSTPLMPHPYLTAMAWLAAIILAIVGGWKNSTAKPGLDRWDVILFLGFTFTAMAIRGFNVAHNPKVLTGDEASSGLSAMLFVQGKMNNIFTIGWYSFPSFFNFLQSLSIRLLGQTTLALRALSVLAGGLTVGAVYLFGSKTFNRWVGVFAAIFLLAFSYHNHFSRIGLNNIWDGLWFTAVLGLLWYGWEKENRLAFLFCGLSLGLAQYFYVSSRVLLGLVPLILVLLALMDRKRAGQRLADISLMGLVFLAVVLPMMFFFIRFPLEYYAPLQRFSIFGEWMGLRMQQTGWSVPRIILDQILLSATGLLSRPMNGPWYDSPTPLLRPIFGIFFLVGLLVLMIKWRSQRAFILILWIALIILAGAMSDNTPAPQRYIAMAPVVALTIGIGLEGLGKLSEKIRPAFTKWIFVTLLAILIVFSADELRFYYFDYSSKVELGGDNGLVAQKLADYLQAKDASWQVAFFGAPRMGYYSYSTLPYLDPQIQGMDMNAPWGSPDNPALTSDHIIFVFLPEHVDDLKAVQASYPNGSLREEKYNDKTLFWLYEVVTQ